MSDEKIDYFEYGQPRAFLLSADRNLRTFALEIYLLFMRHLKVARFLSGILPGERYPELGVSISWVAPIDKSARTKHGLGNIEPDWSGFYPQKAVYGSIESCIFVNELTRLLKRHCVRVTANEDSFIASSFGDSEERSSPLRLRICDKNWLDILGEHYSTFVRSIPEEDFLTQFIESPDLDYIRRRGREKRGWD